jgi:hypothetical protein
MQPQKEIGALAQLLNWPLPDNWTTVLTRFADAWPNYLEYQISFPSGEFALITLGRTPQFLETITTYLQEIGGDDTALAIFQNMRQYVGQATWGLKLVLSHHPEVQLYVKKPLPIPEVLFWLRQRQGVADTAGEIIEAVATQLEKSHTHFVGADFTPGQPVRYQIYFTQYLTADKAVQKRIQQAMACLGLSTAAQKQFDRYHPLLAQPEYTLWLSVGLFNQQIMPSVKLDYSGVRLGVVGLLMEDLNLSPSQRDVLAQIGEQLGVDTADYLGLRLTDGQPPQISLYLTRQCRS